MEQHYSVPLQGEEDVLAAEHVEYVSRFSEDDSDGEEPDGQARWHVEYGSFA